jgi:protein-disulfide isomerase
MSRISGTLALLALALLASGSEAVLGNAPATISIQGAPSLGSTDARVIVIEYSDFQCPYCGTFARDTFSAIDDGYIKPGKVRYVYRHFPLSEAHPKAFRAAEAAECANQQGKFWQMHTRLFANQQALDPPDLTTHAEAVGLEKEAFQKCMNGGAQAKIKRDFNEGLKAGVEGTPTFLIGPLEKDGKVRVLKTLSGMQTRISFTAALDEVLSSSDNRRAPKGERR